jgi:very-short-patch-repair endonuclease
MTVVTSLTAADVDLSRTRADGAVFLKAFLDYAKRGPRTLTEAITEADAGGFDSPFEREVFEELQRGGLSLHRQVGCGGFKIDMAVVDPEAGGRYLLGVECDGATYHSSATARDRDRLRQLVLEGLGWRLCRIWSTDWLRNRQKQVRRVLQELEAAKQPRAVRAEKPLPPLVETVAPSPPLATAPPQLPAYATIEDVPEAMIRATILSLVGEYGATEADDLCVSVSRCLGFKRVGPRIKARIENSLDALARERKLERQDDGRLTAVTSPVGG